MTKKSKNKEQKLLAIDSDVRDTVYKMYEQALYDAADERDEIDNYKAFTMVLGMLAHPSNWIISAKIGKMAFGYVVAQLGEQYIGRGTARARNALAAVALDEKPWIIVEKLEYEVVQYKVPFRDNHIRKMFGLMTLQEVELLIEKRDALIEAHERARDLFVGVRDYMRLHGAKRKDRVSDFFSDPRYAPLPSERRKAAKA